jgi:hypothetical protein
VIALIAAQPHGAWTTGELCQRAYPDAPAVAKKHRVAMLTALRRMVWPGTWSIRRLSRAGVEYCLYDRCDDESQMRALWLESSHGQTFAAWRKSGPNVDKARGAAAEERKWRDASPVERIDIEIADAQFRLGLLGMAGNIDPVAFRGYVERIAALKAERSKLTASA